MERERVNRALARIEAASARIEAVASSPRQTDDSETTRKYEALRRETGEALAELDALIGKLGE